MQVDGLISVERDEPAPLSQAVEPLHPDQDRATVQIPVLDRILSGLVLKGHVLEALVQYLRRSATDIIEHTVRLGLPIPSSLPMRKPGGKNPWRVEEVQSLLDRWPENWPVAMIAQVVARSPGAVRGKARRLGLYRRDRREVANYIRLKPVAEVAPRNDDATQAFLAPVAATRKDQPATPAPTTPQETSEAAEPEDNPVAPAPYASRGTIEAAGPADQPEKPAPYAPKETTDAASPEDNAPPEVQTRRRQRLQWTDDLDEEVARRWFAMQCHRGIATDLGVSSGAVRTRATRLGLPPRDRKKIVPDYVEGRPYDRSLEMSKVKRRCHQGNITFWGERNGPHTSPKVMQTKHYKELRRTVTDATLHL